MPDKTVFWKGIIDPKGILNNTDYGDKSRQKLSFLAEGNTKSADLDLKKGASIYGIRLNRKERLFVMTYYLESQPFLVLLGVDQTHNYKQNSFFRPRGVATFVNKHLVSGNFSVITWDNICNSKVECQDDAKADEGDLLEQVVTFYSFGSDPYVVLTDLQRNAVDTQLPAVVRGAAGSGKTLSALIALANKAEKLNNNPSEERKPILRYVCQSPSLAEKIKEDFYQAYPDQFPHVVIEFNAYKAFNNTGYAEVAVTDFKTWFDKLLSQVSNSSITHKNITSLREHCLKLGYIHSKSADIASILYNEFKVIAYDAHDYGLPNYGKRQCRIQDVACRQHVIKLFNDYIFSLEKAGKIDLQLTSVVIPDDQKCDYMVVDEGQLLTGKQAEVLLQSLHDCSQVMVCCDAQQGTGDILSLNKHLLSKCFNVSGYAGDIYEVMLGDSIRISNVVQKLANTILKIINARINGVTEKGLYTQVQAPMAESVRSGDAIYIRNPGVLTERFKELLKLPTTLVIAPDEVRCVSFKKQFGNGVWIVPAEQCGGLEAETVVIYGFPAGSARPFPKGVNKAALQDGVKSTQPKNKLATFQNEQALIDWRLLYIMVTRSSNQLVVVGDHPLFEIFKPYQKDNDQAIQLQKRDLEKEKEAWSSIVKNYMLDGRHDLAQELFKAHGLGDFNAFKQAVLPSSTVAAKKKVLEKPVSDYGGGVSKEVEPVLPKERQQPAEGQSKTAKPTKPTKLARSRPSRLSSQSRQASSQARAPQLHESKSLVIKYKSSKGKRKSNDIRIDFSDLEDSNNFGQLLKPAQALLKKVQERHILALLQATGLITKIRQTPKAIIGFDFLVKVDEQIQRIDPQKINTKKGTLIDALVNSNEGRTYLLQKLSLEATVRLLKLCKYNEPSFGLSEDWERTLNILLKSSVPDMRCKAEAWVKCMNESLEPNMNESLEPKKLLIQGRIGEAIAWIKEYQLSPSMVVENLNVDEMNDIILRAIKYNSDAISEGVNFKASLAYILKQWSDISISKELRSSYLEYAKKKDKTPGKEIFNMVKAAASEQRSNNAVANQRSNVAGLFHRLPEDCKEEASVNDLSPSDALVIDRPSNHEQVEPKSPR